MLTQDTSKIKKEIINFLQTNGPSLPIQISKHIKMDSLFSSAFLSELLAEHKIRLSKMRVGTSPIYYLAGTEEKLEKYSEHLNFKEKEAYNLLKQHKFLIDNQQHPAIKVALKSISDFAKEFKSENELIWRYFTSSEQDYISKNIPEKPKGKTIEAPKIIEEEKISHSKLKKEKKKPIKKKINQKRNDKFFNAIKEYLSSKQIEILDIEGFSKEDLTLKIKIGNEERLLVAYNKKRITEEEIIKAHKKAKEKQLKYLILSFGEPLKRTTNLIEAIRDLDQIKKIE